MIPCDLKYLINRYISKDVMIVTKQHEQDILLNCNGEEISDEYDEISLQSKQDAALFLAKKDNKYGYINQQGKMVIPLRYNYAEDFVDGLAIADNTAINENGEVLYQANENENIGNIGFGIIAVEKEENVFDIIKAI